MINIRTKIADWLESASTTTTDASAVHDLINESAKSEKVDTSSIGSYQEILEALSDNSIKLVADMATQRGLENKITETLAKKLLNKTSVNEMTFQVDPKYTLQFDTKNNLDKALKTIGDRFPYTVDGLFLHLEKRTYLDMCKGILGCQVVTNESLAGEVLGETDITEEDGKWYVYCSQGKEIYAGPFESEDEAKSNLGESPTAVVGFGNLDSDGNFSTSSEECKMEESLAKQLLNKTSIVESISHTFKGGYLELVTKFWGLKKEDLDTNWSKLPKWVTGPVVMIDEDDPLHDLLSPQFKNGGNEKEFNLKFNNKTIKAFGLDADGGFNTVLISKSDYDSLDIKESLAKQLLNKTN